MKFIDTLEIGITYLKKHKMRFCLNTISISILLMIIFCLCSVLASLYATIDSDLELHLQEQNNEIFITLNGTNHNRKNSSVTLDESDAFFSELEKYGTVSIAEIIRLNSVNLIFKNFDISIPISFIQGKNNPELIEGMPWDNTLDNTNCVWLTQDIFSGLLSINPSFKIGDNIQISIDKTSEFLKIYGIVSGQNTVFIGKKYSVNKNIAYISHVNYNIKLFESSAKTIRQLNALTNKVNSVLAKEDPLRVSRISNIETIYLQNISLKVNIYLLCIIALIIYLTILVLGILKNNAIINIYDNIDNFSIMRCLGLENKKIVHISMIETSFGLFIGVVFGGLISFALSGIVKLTANKLLRKELFNQTIANYRSAWWVILLYFLIILFLSLIYFSLTLTKSLRRKNLFKILKNRG